MRNNRFIIGAIVLFAIVFSSVIVKTHAAESYYPENYTGYRYPIVPGTVEWKRLPDHQAMCDICQIPDNILKNLNTEQLVDTILYYPLFSDVFAYDNIETGLIIISQHFNGLAEFFNRDESTLALLNRINSKNSPSDIKAQARQKSTETLPLSSLQQEFASLLLKEDCLKRTLLRDDVSTIKAYAPRPVKYVKFLSRIPGKTKDVKIKGVTISAQYDSTSLEEWRYTDGSNYATEMKELSTEKKNEIKERNKSIYGIEPIRDASVKYNCHSYAWYSQSKNNKYWINDPSRIISNSTKVREVTKLYTQKNDIMVYYFSCDGSYSEISHSAIIMDYKDYPRSKRVFTVKSKWGLEGLYEHSYSNCPYYYNEMTGNTKPNDIKYFHAD